MTADLTEHADAARNGLCPLCGIGGWASLAQHVARKHGIGARELKRRLGIPVSHALTSPEVAARQRKIHRELGAPPALIEAGRTSRRAMHIGQPGAAAKREAGLRGRFKRQRIRDDQLPDAIARLQGGHTYRAVAAGYGITASALYHRVKKWRSENGHPSPAPTPPNTARPTSTGVTVNSSIQEIRGVLAAASDVIGDAQGPVQRAIDEATRARNALQAAMDGSHQPDVEGQIAVLNNMIEHMEDALGRSHQAITGNEQIGNRL